MDMTTEATEVMVEATSAVAETAADAAAAIVAEGPSTVVLVAAVIGATAAGLAVGYGLYKGSKKLAAIYIARRVAKDLAAVNSTAA